MVPVFSSRVTADKFIRPFYHITASFKGYINLWQDMCALHAYATNLKQASRRPSVSLCHLILLSQHQLDINSCGKWTIVLMSTNLDWMSIAYFTLGTIYYVYTFSCILYSVACVLHSVGGCCSKEHSITAGRLVVHSLTTRRSPTTSLSQWSSRTVHDDERGKYTIN